MIIDNTYFFKDLPFCHQGEGWEDQVLKPAGMYGFYRLQRADQLLYLPTLFPVNKSTTTLFRSEKYTEEPMFKSEGTFREIDNVKRTTNLLLLV
jgi:transposase